MGGGKLLQGQSPFGTEENDPGTQADSPNESVSESDVSASSEKNLPGKPTERGFNPTAK